MLAPGFSRDDRPVQFGAIPATKSFEEWGEGKGMLIASWHCFKGLVADDIVTIGTPVRDDARERANGPTIAIPGACAGAGDGSPLRPMTKA